MFQLSVSEANDGIIFDDCNFSKWAPEDAIALLDWDEERSLPARYSDARIEADIPMIFTTNKKPKEIFPRGKRGQKERGRALVSACEANVMLTLRCACAKARQQAFRRPPKR